jgi:copper(I)-binding protein
MLAAYMTIENPTDQDLILITVSSPRFAHVMMHRSAVVDGMARMIHEDSIKIPARSELELKPGSYHLMMPAPDTRPVAGDSILFELQFANGDRLEVHATVRKP